MSVLVDSSVWIGHLHRADAHLHELLLAGGVRTHAVVIGELAAGRIARRAEFLSLLRKLPRSDDTDLDESLHFLEQHKLWGRGLSWADIQLLASARMERLGIWTNDRPLAAAASHLGLHYAP